MKQGQNQTRPKPVNLILLSLTCIVFLSACSAEMATAVFDGIIDGARIGVHQAIDDHFDEPTEEDKHTDLASEFEDFF